MTGQDKTPLTEEIQRIYQSETDMINQKIKAVIHIEKYDMPVTVVGFSMDRNYASNKTDLTVVTVNMMLSDVVYHLIPEAEHFEVSITRESLGPDITTRFKGVMLSQLSLPSNTYILSTEDLDRDNTVDIELELVDINFYVSRNVTVDGIYRDAEPKHILGSLFYSIFTQIPGVVSDAIHIVESDNTREIPNLIVDSSVRLKDLPDHLQKKYGLYNGGVGTYITSYLGKPHICVYPLYALDKFLWDYEIVFYDSGTAQPDYLYQNRYIKEDDIYKIVASTATPNNIGKRGSMDSNAKAVVVRDAFYNRAPISDGSTVTVSRDQFSLNMTHTKLKDESLQYAYSDDNIHVATESTLKATMSTVDILWRNANIDILRPHVKCTFLQVVKDEILRTTGTIERVMINFDSSSDTVIANIRLKLSY